jgi:photosystem II stability/assembly factor-like uncharacterized protein
LIKVFFLNEQEGWVAGHELIAHTIDGGKSWVRQYPGDTGIHGTIASIFFIDPKTGWVLADGGVYRSVDGGVKWEQSVLPRADYPSMGAPGSGGFAPNMIEDQGDIYFTDKKNGWAVVGFGLIFHTKDGGKAWVNQRHADPLKYGLNRVSFIDSRKGCAIGSSIFCTDDGGATWLERLGVPPGSWKRFNDYWRAIEPHALSFADKFVGFTVGEDGQIMKTDDGGKTWKMISRKDECGRNVFFIDKKTGWFLDIGDDTFICRTDDGGYTRRKQEVGINVRGIYFLNNKTGWAVGARKKPEGEQMPGRRYGKVWAAIRHTTDGGQTWDTQLEELVSKNLYYDGFRTVYFADLNNGWAFGHDGLIYYTENGGRSWKRQKGASLKTDLVCTQFVNPEIGWTAGMRVDNGWTGVILHTEDHGDHWQAQYNIKDIGLTGIFFADKKSGWITGLAERGAPGWLFHTDDAGSTWTKEKLGDVGYSDPFFLDNERGLISTDKGWFFITLDAGKTWKKTRKPIRKHPWHFSEIFEAKTENKKP